MAKNKKVEKEKIENDYTYRFEELVDEMESSIKKLQEAMTINERVRAKLINVGLAVDDDFKDIMKHMKDMHDNYAKQLPILQDRLNIGKEYLESVKEQNELNDTTKKRATMLMDFLGIFAKQ